MLGIYEQRVRKTELDFKPMGSQWGRSFLAQNSANGDGSFWQEFVKPSVVKANLMEMVRNDNVLKIKIHILYCFMTQNVILYKKSNKEMEK